MVEPHFVYIIPVHNEESTLEEHVARIAAEIEKNHVVEGQLRRQVAANIQRLTAAVA